MNKIILMVFVILSMVQMIDMKQDKNSFGKFNLILDRFEPCKGSKSRDCCNITVDMINQTAVDYGLHSTRPLKITKGKVTARANGTDFLRLQMKNPCDHLFMKQILIATLNVSRHCAINPGNYRMVFDLNNIAQTYYGGAFLYGQFTFKSLFMTDDCNFSCTEVDVTFTPKNA